uniref:Cation-transporting ATPase n=1 Tax=Macaca fascicularis TaxID=9541 RepID=A0A7N9IG14_MACFA
MDSFEVKAGISMDESYDLRCASLRGLQAVACVMFRRFLLLQELQEIFGYRTQGCRKSLCLAGSIFSFGILPLVFYWRPAWHVWAHCVPCSLQEADTVLLRTTVSVYLVM